MNWATRHQLFYLGILIFFMTSIAFFIIYPRLHRTPTCMDGKMNGTETGVDCGGMCERACMAEVEAVKVLWSRSFEVVPGRYNAMAYLVNHNKNKITDHISYRFRFADEDNLYLGERVGETYVPPNGNFAVFESGIEFQSAVPVYTTFEILNNPEWLQVTDAKVDQIKVLVSDILLTGEITNPYLTAKIKNNSLFDIPEVSVAAILYDADHNAVNVSRTLVDNLAGDEVRDIQFTWPEPFDRPVVQKEIIPTFELSLVKFR